MSPARSKRTPVPHRRSRAEIVQAVGVAVGIVVVTALIIWLMRPGPSTAPVGTGGLMNRQPRASWLTGAAIGAGLLATWWILRVSRRTRGHEKVALPVALGVILVAAVAAAFAWPGGLLRHVQALPKPVSPTTIPTTTAPAGTTTTPAAGSTTTAPITIAPALTTTTSTGTSTTKGP